MDSARVSSWVMLAFSLSICLSSKSRTRWAESRRAVSAREDWRAQVWGN
jgi:hypothetical protein